MAKRQPTSDTCHNQPHDIVKVALNLTYMRENFFHAWYCIFTHEVVSVACNAKSVLEFLVAFRADEAEQRGYERAKRYLLGTHLAGAEREDAAGVFHDILVRLGPVVDRYPVWHPLISHQQDHATPETYPNDRCGFRGLDHTVYFAHGFISCPYMSGQEIISSVDNLPEHFAAEITAEILDASFYNSGTECVMVTCVWNQDLEPGGLIPKKTAVPLMIEKEAPAWRSSSLGETWETMRPYLLGEPHGSRSSLFVSQDTAMAMKRVYVAMLESGMFGPIRV